MSPHTQLWTWVLASDRHSQKLSGGFVTWRFFQICLKKCHIAIGHRPARFHRSPGLSGMLRFRCSFAIRHNARAALPAPVTHARAVIAKLAQTDGVLTVPTPKPTADSEEAMAKVHFPGPLMLPGVSRSSHPNSASNPRKRRMATTIMRITRPRLPLPSRISQGISPRSRLPYAFR